MYTSDETYTGELKGTHSIDNKDYFITVINNKYEN